jgi:hypothetical protein
VVIPVNGQDPYVECLGEDSVPVLRRPSSDSSSSSTFSSSTSRALLSENRAQLYGHDGEGRQPEILVIR